MDQIDNLELLKNKIDKLKLSSDAEGGNADAQNILGVMYANGLQVVHDDLEAVKWYQKAAEQGNTQAQSNLGLMYLAGRGVKQDDVEAVKWYRKAAEQGNAQAQSNLGIMYANGCGVKQDNLEAVVWFKRAAEQGVAEAQSNLGVMYATGRGVDQDNVEAVKWYRKAADQGYVNSEYALGTSYEFGMGVSRDLSEAVSWYKLAAEHGDEHAQFRLGNLFLQGRGMLRSPTEAIKWLSMSAGKNNYDAEYSLGQMYERGIGFTQDTAKAIEFFKKAAEHGSIEAKERLKNGILPKRATDELDELVGIASVKEEVRKLQARLWWQKKGREKGIKIDNPTLHMVFTGAPGTGKTTVARIVAKIYKETGILSKGHLVEVTRAELIGQYLGQTAPKTTEVVKSAMGGVLFIDEAYSLVPRNAGHQDSYGQEAISTLMKLMEDNRDKFALIVAGYPDEMKVFLDSNSGLKSRFSRYIDFPNYNAEELGEIFRLFLSKDNLRCTASALMRADEYFNEILKVADKKTFGNAREVRNILELAIDNKALRLQDSREVLTVSKLQTLDLEDFHFLSKHLSENP